MKKYFFTTKGSRSISWILDIRYFPAMKKRGINISELVETPI
jgi:hypothetical protein